MITNKGGKVHIINGTITSSQANAVINNERGDGYPVPELYISGGRIIATGTKQAVWNVGGHLEISDDAYLSSTSMNRATVHSLTNGEVFIYGGTIESTGYAGVRIDSTSQLLTVGTKGDGIDTSTPVIRGKSNAILAYKDVKFYDGILMSSTSKASIIDRSKIADHDGTINDNGTTEIDGVIYYTLYNE